ncbi:MAG: TIGR02147 family protein, partial [Bdellovibrionota bacterium]
EMGFRSHSLMVAMLKGVKEIQFQHIPKLMNGFQFSSHGKLYFQTLCHLKEAKKNGGKEQLKTAKLWHRMHIHRDLEETKQVKDFRTIASPLHMTILAMTWYSDFELSAEYIVKRIQTGENHIDIDAAITDLLEAGLLKHSQEGGWNSTFTFVKTKDDVADKSVKEFHRRSLDDAGRAIFKQTLDQREFQSLVVAVDSALIKDAKEAIRKFVKDFCQTYGNPRQEKCDSVYQLNLQFFQRATGKKNEKH